jgi:hypothetical protein
MAVKTVIHFFPVAQDPSSGLNHLIVEVSRLHAVRDTQPIGLLYTSDQPVAEAATSTTQHKRQKSLPSTGSEPAIPGIKRLIYMYILLRPYVHRDRLICDF